MRIVVGAFSQIRNILVLMAVMVFHVLVSYALEILERHGISASGSLGSLLQVRNHIGIASLWRRELAKSNHKQGQVYKGRFYDPCSGSIEKGGHLHPSHGQRVYTSCCLNDAAQYQNILVRVLHQVLECVQYL